MQSKQKKRGKALKQVAAGTRPKGTPNRTRKSRPAGAGSAVGSRQTLEAPIAGSVIQRNFFGWRFGSAARHDEYPEGGLRISGVLPGSTNTGSIYNDTVSTGLFGTSGIVGAYVNPCGGAPAAGNCTAAMFSPTGPLALFSQYFRRFRFRKLSFEYSATISTSNAENITIQFVYERDPYLANAATYTIESAVTAITHRFVSWTPTLNGQLIDQKKPDPADELFYTILAGDSFASNASYDRMSSQGAVVSQGSALAVGADLLLGKMMWHFVIDLYGFANVAETGVTRSVKPINLSRKEDEKHFDFVESTPKSKLVDPPPSRVSSRKA